MKKFSALKLKISPGRWDLFCTMLLMLRTRTSAWPPPKTDNHNSFRKPQYVGPEYTQNPNRAVCHLFWGGWRGRGPISEQIFNLRYSR